MHCATAAWACRGRIALGSPLFRARAPITSRYEPRPSRASTVCLLSYSFRSSARSAHIGRSRRSDAEEATRSQCSGWIAGNARAEPPRERARGLDLQGRLGVWSSNELATSALAADPSWSHELSADSMQADSTTFPRQSLHFRATPNVLSVQCRRGMRDAHDRARDFRCGPRGTAVERCECSRDKWRGSIGSSCSVRSSLRRASPSNDWQET